MSDYLLQGNFWRGLFGGYSGSPNKLNSERRAFSNVCSLHSCAQGQYQDEIVETYQCPLFMPTSPDGCRLVLQTTSASYESMTSPYLGRNVPSIASAKLGGINSCKPGGGNTSVSRRSF
ncbi:hypothetical protein COCVIDRAFT_12078 [Bipolaris victoriae FI3]|uniref:Uncharacterized protein n=1 Tax=Bipolaris victoriae (strain FI3) TaxID=930091 RepID=W7EU83_BIPV3|nr:hypothetical protein COCVIDRAFT_12078 [Bipolaris victoriae FI3]